MTTSTLTAVAYRHPLARPWLRRLLGLSMLTMFTGAVSTAIALLAFWASLPDVAPLADRKANLTITVRDWQGNEHPFVLGPQNPDWTPLTTLPEELPWAVIVAEDANFYKHNGFDPEAIREALLYDLEQKRLALGASTITQQLAKNLYLSREKSFVRKLRELAIAWQLEQQLGKERILELYLNLVELGPLVHGVGAGTRYHFAKPASSLSPAEAAYLAAILPGPRVAYNPDRHPERVRRRAEKLLDYMQLRRKLDADSYQLALAEVSLLGPHARKPLSPLPEFDEAPQAPVEETVPLQDGDSVPPWQLPITSPA